MLTRRDADTRLDINSVETDDEAAVTAGVPVEMGTCLSAHKSDVVHVLSTDKGKQSRYER